MQQQFDRSGGMSKDNVKVILGRSGEMLSRKLLKILSLQRHNYDTDSNKPGKNSCNHIPFNAMWLPSL